MAIAPYYNEDGITIYNADALVALREMPSQSVNCCVTSPPYYGLRDYGVDGQIGLEETPEAYIARLVEVFREVRRALKDDGTLWVNIGDSYWGGKGQSGTRGDSAQECRYLNGNSISRGYQTLGGAGLTRPTDSKHPIIKPKDLIGIPWMLAFALRADGWYLRSEIIWHKPNPMPESVKDRPTKAHEQIFLLSKSPKYFYDADAVKEPSKAEWGTRNRENGKYHNDGSGLRPHSGLEKSYSLANRRSVWTVTPKPYKEAHFATFPPDLIKPCILAGCPEGGTVLDPFGGSGTTAQVAIENRRNAVLIELNLAYVELIQRRIEKAKQARKQQSRSLFSVLPEMEVAA